MISDAQIKKGQAVYTAFMLKLYNLLVLDISNRWLWRCLKQVQLERFNLFLSSMHLDIGVGTGYYLQACQSPALKEIALMDLNPNCLNASEASLKKRGLTAKTYLADIFKPQPELAQKFNSISMNYLLHCLPGDMPAKEVCIANATAMLVPGGTLFGATILADETFHTKASRSLAAFYNKKGLFSNQADSLAALKTALSNQLIEVNIKVIGSVALFDGKAR